MSTKRKGTGGSKKGTTASVKDVVVVSRISEDTAQRFRVYADAQARSISKQIRFLIEDAINAEEEEKAA